MEFFLESSTESVALMNALTEEFVQKNCLKKSNTRLQTSTLKKELSILTKIINEKYNNFVQDNTHRLEQEILQIYQSVMYKFRVLKEELSKCRFDNSRKIRQIQVISFTVSLDCGIQYLLEDANLELQVFFKIQEMKLSKLLFKLVFDFYANKYGNINNANDDDGEIEDEKLYTYFQNIKKKNIQFASSNEISKIINDVKKINDEKINTKIDNIKISIEHELEKFKEEEKLQFSLWQETYINNKTNNEIENQKEKDERHLLHEIMAFSNDVKQLKSRLAFYSA
ncbi:uncharacterized protein LOC122851938 [Aphidius gifuensis]|uniref:uncharacterized protein LOC122851938 n=1 Tax=Aphidius gifuensis TaxID=684658 RepID=UPI001CDD2BBA|nr:uncharacterized protein LOC122851938 [Aphidius gifuensis]